MTANPYTRVRYSAGALFILAMWLFSSSAGGSRDALQQLFALGALSAASILFGLSAIAPLLTFAVIVGSLLMIATPNPYWGTSIAGVAGLLLLGLACYVGAHLRRTPEALRWFLLAIVAAAFLNATEGLLQWFGLVGELYKWVIEPERRGLAFGALRQPNLFATFLCVGAVCVIWLVQLRRVTPAMAWFLLTVLMFGVAASRSRTGLLEIATLAIWAVVHRRHQISPVTRLFIGQFLLLMLAMAVLPLAASWLEFEFTSGVARGALVGQDARPLIWRNAIEMIAAQPWTGWGWRETGFAHYTTFFDKRFEGLLENVHNLPLQLAVEFGLPIAALLSGLSLWAIWRAKPWRISNETQYELADEKPSVEFAWAILLLIVGIHSMLEYPLWYAGFLFLSGVAVGYVLPIGPRTRTNTMTPYQIWSTRFAQFTALMLILLAVTGWQQYAKVLLIYKTPFTNNRDIQRAAVKSALDNAAGAWLFQEHLDFATLNSTPLTPQNAAEVRQRAEKLLHFSAEPRVIQPLLQSLWYLNDVDALRFHAERYCRSFPSVFQKWMTEQRGIPLGDAIGPLSEKCNVLLRSASPA